MNRPLLLLAFSLVLLQISFAQESEEYELKQLRLAEAQRYASLEKFSKTATPGQEGFDVTYYKLDLRLSTSPNNLSGSVTMVAKSIVDSLSSVTLDLMNSMTVDSVLVANVRSNFTQLPRASGTASNFSISLNRSYARGEVITTTVYYHGVPGSSGFGSFVFATTQSGSPWVWSLSEPYGSKDWWPSKDHPGDKADSVDVWVTCDGGFKVGSQGRLVAVVQNPDGTKTHKWQHRYPIATYLVSVAIGPYVEATGWFVSSSSDSMLVLNYSLPDTSWYTASLNSIPKTIDMLRIFSDLFGLYPFVTEKYGHSQFGWPGGMEHQTMTSLGSFGENLVAHELAHQWFGDMITMATWPDIWLNEGFATYCVALYQEKKYGQSAYWSYMNGQMNSALSATGSIYVRDTSSVGKLFDGRLVYAKGATILHMLRHVIGDSLFFKAIKQYATDPRFKFNTASTADFQSVCESVYGQSLEYFFKQWIYGEKYPQYRYEWGKIQTGSEYRIRITLRQTTGTSNPAYFTMPVDFRLTGTGLDTTVALMNDAQNQTFVFNLPKEPDSVQLDPRGWILKQATGVVVNLDDVSAAPRDFALLQNYPNPFNSATTIPFELPVASTVRLDVFNLLGELVQTLASDKLYEAGRHALQFSALRQDGTSLPSGVYYYRLSVSGVPLQVRKMIYLR